MRERTGAKSLLFEGLAVALAGALFAFAANALSPRGLRLSSNFFSPTTTSANAAAETNRPGALGASAATNHQSVVERLAAEGLKVAGSNEVAQLYQDPRREQELVVFIDSRNDQDYQEGHIPGAYQLDYYRKEKYLPQIIPICQAAQVVVIYCNGGECVDSEYNAQVLSSIVPKDRLVVYAGGMSEWSKNRQPVEVGDRGSGQFKSQ